MLDVNRKVQVCFGRFLGRRRALVMEAWPRPGPWIQRLRQKRQQKAPRPKTLSETW